MSFNCKEKIQPCNHFYKHSEKSSPLWMYAGKNLHYIHLESINQNHEILNTYDVTMITFSTRPLTSIDLSTTFAKAVIIRKN